ncbi:MAG: hypothetical protein FWD17_11895, partial [Polyangiaceae bacterium]|nr:hypothetical protein [Polyangiaceae bacterium]
MTSQIARTPRKLSVGVASLGIVLAGLLSSGVAQAAGTLTLKTPSVDERTGGEWHVKVRIDLPRAPSMMHTPMRFTFSKEVVDERAIMKKGAEPEHHRMVLETPTKQIVGLDVDFADPAGKVFKSTYFEFDLERKDGFFEAGEYVMTLSGPDGEIGGPQKITLKGDNPPVYRGAMDFSDSPKAKKKTSDPNLESVSNGIDGGSQQVAQNDVPSAAPTSTEVAAEGPAPDMVPTGAYNRTSDETLVDHPKGCGCVAAGLYGAGGWAPALTLAIGCAGAFVRRR